MWDFPRPKVSVACPSDKLRRNAIDGESRGAPARPTASLDRAAQGPCGRGCTGPDRVSRQGGLCGVAGFSVFGAALPSAAGSGRCPRRQAPRTQRGRGGPHGCGDAGDEMFDDGKQFEELAGEGPLLGTDAVESGRSLTRASLHPEGQPRSLSHAHLQDTISMFTLMARRLGAGGLYVRAREKPRGLISAPGLVSALVGPAALPISTPSRVRTQRNPPPRTVSGFR